MKNIIVFYLKIFSIGGEFFYTLEYACFVVNDVVQLMSHNVRKGTFGMLS